MDKPHFLPVTPVGRYVQESLLVRLKRKLGLDELAPLHRIDRETAGVVLFSVQPATRGSYSALFAEREIVQALRGHRAVARRAARCPPCAAAASRPTRISCACGRWPANRTPRRASSCWSGATAGRACGLSPLTGRRHQLRVHCAALGMPILNDAIYPRLLPEGEEDFDRPLQLLARRLAFRDPVTGMPREFTSTRSLALPLLDQSTKPLHANPDLGNTRRRGGTDERPDG